MVDDVTECVRGLGWPVIHEGSPEPVGWHEPVSRETGHHD